MLRLRLREYSPMGVKGNILQALNINYGAQLNDDSTLSFSLSQADSKKMSTPYVVGVEYATTVGSAVGEFKPLPNNDRFIVFKDSGDDTDTAKIVNYTGRNYLVWLLAKTYLHWSSAAKDGERTFNRSPGWFFRILINESKARGWGTQFGIDFTNNVDSNGASWVAGDVFSQSWRLTTRLDEVLSELTSSGLCDWSTSGMNFRMFRAETLGSDKSHVVLGGPGTERMPIEVDASDIFTNLTIIPEKGNWQYAANSGQGTVTKFGRLEATLTQGGVSSPAEAQKLSQATLKVGRTIVRQESFEWSPSKPKDYMPWDDFDIGDMITTGVRGGKSIRRVQGILVNENNGMTTVNVIAGEKASTSGAKLRDRLSSVSVGGFTGGNGTGFPTMPPLLNSIPDKPLGLLVMGNEPYWVGGTAVSPVRLVWAPVTADTEGGEIDISLYEVWSRTASGDAAFETSSITNEVLVEQWPAGITRYVKVRAISDRGAVSEFSDEIAVTPAIPSALTPKAPTNLSVVSNTAAFTAAGPVATIKLGWEAVTEATDDEPITVTEYEVWVDDAPLIRVVGTSATVTQPSGVAREYRVVAITGQGVRGDLSTPITVTGTTPTVSVAVPTAPTLISGSANVVAAWDGSYTTPGIGTHTVRVEARVGSGAWQPQGAALTGSGSQLVRLGDVGDTVEVRLVAYDQLGRETGISATVSIVVEGIDGDDIIAGTIEGNRIVAGSISVDELTPNIGEQINIYANEAVQIIVGDVESLGTAVSDAQEDADQALSDAEQAAIEAGAAQAAAAIADGKALVAQSLAQGTQDELTAHQAVFRVVQEGAEVASIDGSNVLRLTPDGVQIVQGGTPASTWDAGRLIVNEIVVNHGQLANHSVEKSGSTRTIIRPIN